MITEVINNNFSELRTVAMFSTESNDTSYSFLYHASSTSAIIDDFIEYDLKSVLRKSKYSDFFKLNYIDYVTESLIGNNFDDLDLFNKTFFPTIDNSSDNVILDPRDINSSTFKYFGSINLNNGDKIYILDIPERINYIEIFANKEDFEFGYRKNSKDAVIKITFGVTNSTSSTLTDLQKSLLEDEIKSRKLVFIQTSSNGEVTIKYSQYCWDINKNSNRNKSYWTLRNDLYETTKNYLSTFDIDNLDCIVDGKSNTLVSQNHKIDSVLTPILNKKVNRAKQNIEDKKYNPVVQYRKEDRVNWGDTLWWSNQDHNADNIPSLSPAWISEKFITGCFYKKIEIKVVDENGNDLSILPRTTYLSIYGDSMSVVLDTKISGYSYIEDSIRFNEDLELSDFPDLTISSPNQNDIYLIQSNNNLDLLNILENVSYITLSYRVASTSRINVRLFYKDIEVNTADQLYTDLSKSISVFIQPVDRVSLGNRKLISSLLSDPNNLLSVRLGELQGNHLYKVLYFKVNGKQCETDSFIENYDSTVDLDIFIDDQTYIVSVIDEDGRFEVSSNYIEVTYNSSINLDFYIAAEFDAENSISTDYIFNELEIRHNGSSEVFKSYTYNSDNGTIEETTNTDYSLPTFEFCDLTKKERQSREVWTFSFNGIVKDCSLILRAMPKIN